MRTQAHRCASCIDYQIKQNQYQKVINSVNYNYTILNNQFNDFKKQSSKINNEYITGYKQLQLKYNRKINEYRNKYELLQNKYNQDIVQYQNKYKLLQNKHHKEINENIYYQNTLKNQLSINKKKLQTLTNKYTKIIPEVLYNDKNRLPPSDYYRSKSLGYIKIILFSHQRYCFDYIEVMKLFDEILIEMNAYSYPLIHCASAIDAVHEYYRNIGTSCREYKVLQQSQCITSALMKINGNSLTNAELFKEILNQSVTRNTNVYILNCKYRRIQFNNSILLSKDYSHTGSGHPSM